MNIIVRVKQKALRRILWGSADALPRPLCAICCGGLPEVPFMLWKDDGSAASLCDPCADESLDVQINPENFK